MARKRLVKKRLTKPVASAKRKPRRARRRDLAPDRKAKQAVAGLLKGLRLVEEHSAMALSHLEGIRQEAVLARERQLAEHVVSDRLLDNLMTLERLLVDGASDGGLDAVRAVPAAVLRWASAHLNLTSILVPNERVDVPTDQVSRYMWLGEDPVGRPGGLVSARVVRSGWKWRGEELSPPALQRADR